MSLSPYLLNVALHATTLSAALTLAVLCVRNPYRRAALSLSGLLAVLLLPWLSALRSQPEKTSAVWVSPVMVKLPQWTVVHLPPSTASPALTAPAPQEAASVTAAATSASFPVQQAVTKRPPLELRTVAAWAWLIGTTVFAVTLSASYFRLVRWKRQLAPLSDAEWELLKKLPLPARMERRHFLTAAQETSPCVAGLLRPVVVVPRFLFAAGQEQELRWALGHEACHRRNGDSRWIAVLGCIRALYWWNPLAHVLTSSWSEARERVCDLAAANDQRADYGRFLVAMAARPLSTGPLTMPIVRRQRLRVLRSRVVALLNAKFTAQTSLGGRFHVPACTALLAGGVLVSGITIAQDNTPAAAPSGKREPGGATVVYDFNDDSDLGKAQPEGKAPFDLSGGPPPEVSRLITEMMDSGDSPLAGPIPEAGALPADGTQSPNVQTMIQANIVYSNHAIVDDRQVIPVADYETFRSNLLKDRSTIVAGLPTFTARDGESGLVEIIRELIYPTGKDKWVTKKLGWQLHVSTFFENQQLTLYVQAEYGFIPGHAFRNEDPVPAVASGDVKTFKSITGQSHAILKPGDMLVTPLGLVEDGCYATVFTRAREIDASGRPVGPGMFPPEHSSPKEKVRLKGTISTYALTEGQKEFQAQTDRKRKASGPNAIESWVHAQTGEAGDPAPLIPFFAADRPYNAASISYAYLREIGKGIGPEETLEPVEIPCGEMVQPWKNMNLKLRADLADSFLATPLTIAIHPEALIREPLPYWSPITVVELKPVQPGTRRLLFITPEWIR